MEPESLKHLLEMLIVRNVMCRCGRHSTLEIVGLPVEVSAGEIYQPEHIELELVYQ